MLPIYIKRIKVTNEKTKYEIEYHIHNSLLDELRPLRIKIEYKSGNLVIKNWELITKVDELEVYENMVSRTITIESDQTSVLHKIEVWFVHRNTNMILFSDSIDQDSFSNVTDEISSDIAPKLDESDNMNQELESPINIKIETLYMGDVFQNIHNATIINKALVENAFNKIKNEYDEEKASALLDLAEYVENSRDPSAGLLLDGFTEELNKSNPDKSRLKNFWCNLQKVLPSVAAISKSVESILSILPA